MKRYYGIRGNAGQPNVQVRTELSGTPTEEVKLDPKPSQKLFNHSPDGFNWGYHGSGCAQLSLALLFDVTGDAELSVRLYQEFQRQFVASWSDIWEIDEQQIKDWVSRTLNRNPEGVEQ